MGSLRIFPTDPSGETKPRNNYAEDIVGRFRSGYQIDDVPASLNDWRVTTGDPEVAAVIHELLGGDPAKEWETKSEDNLELFTASPSVEIVIPGPSSLRQQLVLWGRSGKPIYTTDGETKDDGTPDPDRDLSFAERKAKGRAQTGPVPDIELIFRLADEPDLGLFKFKSGSWSLVSDLDYNGVEEQLAEINGPTKATLKLEPVSFVLKNGPRAGQPVAYVKPVLKIKGAA